MCCAETSKWNYNSRLRKIPKTQVYIITSTNNTFYPTLFCTFWKLINCRQNGLKQKLNYSFPSKSVNSEIKFLRPLNPPPPQSIITCTSHFTWLDSYQQTVYKQPRAVKFKLVCVRLHHVTPREHILVLNSDYIFKYTAKNITSNTVLWRIQGICGQIGTVHCRFTHKWWQSTINKVKSNAVSILSEKYSPTHEITGNKNTECHWCYKKKCPTDRHKMCKERLIAQTHKHQAQMCLAILVVVPLLLGLLSSCSWKTSSEGPQILRALCCSLSHKMKGAFWM